MILHHQLNTAPVRAADAVPTQQRFEQQRRERLERMQAAAINAPAPLTRRIRVVVPVTPPVEEPAPAPPPRIATSKGRAIVVEVALAHGLNWRDLIGPGRTQKLVAPRNEVAFRLITELRMSYPAAGRVLGGRDHTTVLHACRRYAASSPEAAAAWRRHIESEQATRAQKAEAARSMHARGMTIKHISASLHMRSDTLKQIIFGGQQ